MERHRRQYTLVHGRELPNDPLSEIRFSIPSCNHWYARASTAQIKFRDFERRERGTTSQIVWLCLRNMPDLKVRLRVLYDRESDRDEVGVAKS